MRGRSPLVLTICEDDRISKSPRKYEDEEDESEQEVMVLLFRRR